MGDYRSQRSLWNCNTLVACEIQKASPCRFHKSVLDGDLELNRVVFHEPELKLFRGHK